MSLLAYSLITIIQKLFWLVDILILIRVLLSWFPMNNNFTDLIYNITDPMLKPFKDFLDKYINLPIDFSPLLFLLCLQAVERILMRLIIVISEYAKSDIKFPLSLFSKIVFCFKSIFPT